MLIVSSVGIPLHSFFEGLPVTPAARDIVAVNSRRLSKPATGLLAAAVKLEHFLGLGSVVYARGVCVGSCNEIDAPPADCGFECGVRNFTLQGPTNNGLGEMIYDACTACSGSSQGSETCVMDGC